MYIQYIKYLNLISRYARYDLTVHMFSRAPQPRHWVAILERWPVPIELLLITVSISLWLRLMMLSNYNTEKIYNNLTLALVNAASLLLVAVPYPEKQAHILLRQYTCCWLFLDFAAFYSIFLFLFCRETARMKLYKQKNTHLFDLTVDVTMFVRIYAK